MHNVLLILESEDMRYALQKAMQNDYIVTSCGDAVTGAELLQDQPDAMILDLFLPGIDGLSLLMDIHGYRPPVIIVLTRFISQDILQELSDLGVSYVFMEPCSVPAVVDRLNKLLL